MDGTDYDEINELILASDLLISDYSSCLFDAMLAGCRVMIYASDIEEYAKERGFYFRWEELPFPLSTDNASLEEKIMEFQDEKFCDHVSAFKKEMGCIHNGNASEAVVEHILNVLR